MKCAMKILAVLLLASSTLAQPSRPIEDPPYEPKRDGVHHHATALAGITDAINYLGHITNRNNSAGNVPDFTPHRQDFVALNFYVNRAFRNAITGLVLLLDMDPFLGGIPATRQEALDRHANLHAAVRADVEQALSLHIATMPGATEPTQAGRARTNLEDALVNLDLWDPMVDYTDMQFLPKNLVAGPHGNWRRIGQEIDKMNREVWEGVEKYRKAMALDWEGVDGNNFRIDLFFNNTWFLIFDYSRALAVLGGGAMIRGAGSQVPDRMALDTMIAQGTTGRGPEFFHLSLFIELMLNSVREFDGFGRRTAENTAGRLSQMMGLVSAAANRTTNDEARRLLINAMNDFRTAWRSLDQAAWEGFVFRQLPGPPPSNGGGDCPQCPPQPECPIFAPSRSVVVDGEPVQCVPIP